MIRTAWPYLAVMLLAAGVFPALERRYHWRVFSFAPPIVLTYLLVTALAVAGLWQNTPEIVATHKMAIGNLVPALVFLLMINCDLRAILALGPRVLAVFFTTTLTLAIAFVLSFLIYRRWITGDGWQPIAALSGSWVGGTANMVAVKQAIGMGDSLMAMSLLTDALCYSVWAMILFSIARLAPAFNRWTGARSSGELVVDEPRAVGPASADGVLVWLGAALLVAAGCAALAARLPATGMISATTWTILLATFVGLVAGQSPLARFPGAAPLSGALLAAVVAVLASQADFHGFAQAPIYLLCGATIIALHAVLLALAAKLFKFDLYLCGIASLAHIGGVATTPVLAASYARALAPVGVLLALLGYVLGTGFGIGMASVLSRLAIP
jgi:uncharacterized membrane protein